MVDHLAGIVGQVLVGDAITNLLVPREHMLLWEPLLPEGAWKAAVRGASEQPFGTRMTAVMEGAFGVFLIYYAVRNIERQK